MADLQVPAENIGQAAAADEAAAGAPLADPPDNLDPADPQEAEDHRDEAELDDEEEEEEDVRLQDANNGGQGECEKVEVHDY